MTRINGKYGVFEIIDGDAIVSESFRLYGEWSEFEIELFKRFIKPGSDVADVGGFIGSHSIALARLVGENGRVHAFEPRPEIFAYLKKNIELNALDNITPYNVGLGSIQTLMHVDAVVMDIKSNLGGLSLLDNSGPGTTTCEIKKLDDFTFNTLDLIKIDVEGMEAAVIAGGLKSIARHRPVIFAECNSISGAQGVLNSCDNLNYKNFGIVYAAYNPKNYLGNSFNMFDENGEAAILLIPEEKVSAANSGDLIPLNNLDDIAKMLLRKSQYRVGLSTVLGSYNLKDTPDLENTRSPDDMNVWVTAKNEIPENPIHLVIPFYKNEDLVVRVIDSLKNIRNELHDLRVSIFLYNDSPDYPALRGAIEEGLQLGEGLDITVIENETNLGFVGTVNRAFNKAVEANADVILLNSDTVVFPGALREMAQVAIVDPMIGFVAPRSNNATLASFPHDAINELYSPEEGYARFIQTAHHLPRVSLVPTAVGFCFFVKFSILAEFGGFDVVYGAGYNEENDLVMRANQCGYRAALANHAFVWHEGEKSFSVSGTSKSIRDSENAAKLNKRYPEYPVLISQYFKSPEFRAEALISELEVKKGKIKIAFDFSNVGEYYNGTFEAAIKLLSEAVRVWPDCYDLIVFMDQGAWNFHQLAALGRARRLDAASTEERAAMVIRMGQVFDAASLARLVTRAPVVSLFMLDVISLDCGHLSLTFDQRVWHFIAKHTNVIFGISAYTLDRMRKRFAIAKKVDMVVARLSMDVKDYEPSETTGTNDYIFVVGNHFKHKFVKPTVDKLAAALPNEKIFAMGYGAEKCQYENVTCLNSGHISDDDFANLYRNAKVVVFPSHYEGFGFPPLHALAKQKKVFARESALYHELAEHIKGANNLILYETTDQLIALLRSTDLSWQAPSNAGETNGWQRCASDVLTAIECAMHKVDYQTVVSRLRALDMIFAQGGGAGNLGIEAQLQERDRLIQQIAASHSWRLTRPLRVAARIMRGQLKIADVVKRLGSK